MQVWQPAYVGLGSNLQDPLRQISMALRHLAALPRTRLVSRSPLYASAPLGPADQPDFVNAAAGLLTGLAAPDLLEALLEIEQSMGRVRLRHWGPRVIDLDLLAHGNLVYDTPRLRLPHPGIPSRNFVLYPLADLAPTLDLPGHGRVGTLAAAVGNEGLRRIGHAD
ncbi:MAG: hypothetical protein RL026_1613 [Pseudomonadota bacterium]